MNKTNNKFSYILYFFQTFKKSAIQKDSQFVHCSPTELEEQCWNFLSSEGFNILGDYAMDIEKSIFDEINMKRGNLNQLNRNTLLERLPTSIPVSYCYYYLLFINYFVNFVKYLALGFLKQGTSVSCMKKWFLNAHYSDM